MAVLGLAPSTARAQAAEPAISQVNMTAAAAGVAGATVGTGLIAGLAFGLQDATSAEETAALTGLAAAAAAGLSTGVLAVMLRADAVERARALRDDLGPAGCDAAGLFECQSIEDELGTADRLVGVSAAAFSAGALGLVGLAIVAPRALATSRAPGDGLASLSVVPGPGVLWLEGTF